MRFTCLLVFAFFAFVLPNNSQGLDRFFLIEDTTLPPAPGSTPPGDEFVKFYDVIVKIGKSNAMRVFAQIFCYTIR